MKKNFSEMDVTFVFPPGVGDGTENEIVPLANDYNQWPQHVKLTLVDYPSQDTTAASEPQIMVFPANEFTQMGNCPQAEINGLEEVWATEHTELSKPLPCSSVASVGDEVPCGMYRGPLGPNCVENADHAITIIVNHKSLPTWIIEEECPCNQIMYPPSLRII